MRGKKNILLVLAVYAVLCGFSDPKLGDIETAILKEDYTPAQNLARDLLKGQPPKDISNEARYYLGLSLLRQNQYEPAKEIFTELSRSNLAAQLRDKVFLGLFDSYYMAEHYPQALKIGTKMLKQSPHSEFLSLMYLKMARVDLKLTRWKEAGEYLRDILKDFSDSLEARVAKQLLEEKQYFSVQIGAFMDQTRAEQLVSELTQRKQYAYIVETTDWENTKFYRVRVGQLSLLEDAQKLKNEISSQGYPAQIYP